jgi:hypothetical protein
MATRLGAWLIDSMILGGFQIAFWLVASATGAVGINPEAEQQLRTAPFALTTVPPFRTNLPLLAALLAAFVLLNVAYAAVFWARFRGLPGQRLTSLQVGTAATGHNLSLRRALIRAVVAVGIPVAAVSVLLFAVMVIETAIPWSEVVNTSSGGAPSAQLSAWSLVVDVVMLVAIGWPCVLLLSTAASPTRQGLHDRLAGSLVVGKGGPSWAGSVYGPVYGPPEYPAYPGYGPSPGYGPPGVPPAGGWPPAGLPLGPTPPDTSEGAPAGVAQASESPPSTSGPPEEGQAEPRAEAGPDQARGPGEGPGWLRSEAESDTASARHAATVGRRVAAYVFDCVVVYLVFALMETAVALAFLPGSTTTVDERTYILLGLVGGFWQLAYFASGWAIWRGTIGQRLMGMEVTEATTGKALGWIDSLVRWAVLQGPFALVTIVPQVASGAVLVAASVWVWFLLYTTRNDRDLRGLHDRFLNSRVTQED